MRICSITWTRPSNRRPIASYQPRRCLLDCVLFLSGVAATTESKTCSERSHQTWAESSQSPIIPRTLSVAMGTKDLRLPQKTSPPPKSRSIPDGRHSSGTTNAGALQTLRRRRRSFLGLLYRVVPGTAEKSRLRPSFVAALSNSACVKKNQCSGLEFG